MSNFIDNILKESLKKEELNEFLGFSKAERDAKQARVMKLEQIKVARQEIKEFPVTTLVGQPGHEKGKRPTDEDVRAVMAARVMDAKMNMPNFAKLFPKIFTLRPGSSNGASINYKYEGCYIPVEFWFAVANHTISKETFDNRAFRMLDELEMDLKKK